MTPPAVGSAASRAADAVLLVAFGGPTEPADIRPFLANVSRGRAIPTERLEAVARHYEAMPGGRSPLLDITLAQARALEAELARSGLALPVRVGMRNWHPYLADALGELARAGARRAVVVILSALRTEASWERYQTDVERARAAVPGAPEIVVAPLCSREPGFVDAVADGARRTLAAAGLLDASSATSRAAGLPFGGHVPTLFTAHSVPVAMAAASPYVADFEAIAAAVAARAGLAPWSLAWQSRSGRPDEPWLEPDVCDAIRRLAGEGAQDVLVVPAGFVADHVEVLYDLDIEARATACGLGVTLHRAPAVNAHPRFIEALAAVVRRAADA